MKQYVTAQELADQIGCSASKAYTLIRQMNQELKQMGYIVLPGKVPRAYLTKKYFGYEDQINAAH